MTCCCQEKKTARYKVVEDPRRDFRYYVYKRCLFGWKRIGRTGDHGRIKEIIENDKLRPTVTYYQ